MAFQMNVTTAGELAVRGAYVRAVPSGFGKNDDGEWLMVVGLTVFKNATVANAGGTALVVPSLDRFKIPYPLTTKANAIRHAYLELAKLPQFASATEV